MRGVQEHTRKECKEEKRKGGKSNKEERRKRERERSSPRGPKRLPNNVGREEVIVSTTFSNGFRV